jgi:lambda repressor-like predicted transcriptional regulator
MEAGMTNERLRTALVKAGATPQTLSEHLGVDPKTIERWISKDRVPHRRHRLAAAAHLGVDDVFLWPSTERDPRNQSATRAEFTDLYPNRGAVPTSLWEELIDSATEAIDLLAFAASFLHDSVPNFDQRLIDKARSGVPVRLLFGDPDSAAVRLRGEEERIGDLLSARCRLTWNYYTDALEAPGIEARAHGCTLYASIFRFDDRLLVNPHMYGSPASHSPVHVITRVAGGRLFSNYMTSYERTWSQAQPLPAAS